ncbi:MAG: radical SAM protein [Bacteroidales bacterium]|nr:radical SAM protein [Bacteroidales bacterium]
MSHTVAIIAPMVDLEQYNLDFRLVLDKSKRELTLSTLQELAQNGFHTDKIVPVPSKKDMMPAAGFYLAGLLRENGYETLLTHKCNQESLESIAKEKPLAVCLSSTMILSNESLKNYLKLIRCYLPETSIIVGGIYIWKSYQFYELHWGREHAPDESSLLLFHAESSDFPADVYVAAPHGRESLLLILKELQAVKTNFDRIPNLAIPDKAGGFLFTERKIEEVDYNKDFTRWDLIDVLPDQIPIRTSIGCPFRCLYCDFYRLFPRIILRSKESLQSELGMIHTRIKGKHHIIHTSDDNVFINNKQLIEVSEAFIASDIQRWIGFMRPSAINESNIGIVKRSGLMISLVGVESGDNDQLVRMNKLQKLENVKRGIELLDQNGINVMMTYIVGFPGETAETVNNTARFINGLDIGLASSSYMLFPLFISPFSDLALPEYRQKWKIRGMFNKWSHYTMDSQQSIEISYELFKQVSRVPYHYSEERTFYNQQAFSDEQRQKLFELRHELSLAYIEKFSREQKISILRNIAEALQVTDKKINHNLLDEITVGSLMDG